MKKLMTLKYQLITLLVFVLGYSLVVFLLGNNTERGLDAAYITTYVLMMVGIAVYLITLFISNNKKVLGAIDAVNGPNTMSLFFLLFSFTSTTILYFINYSPVIIFVIIGYIFIFTIFLVIYILSFKQQELINQNPNKIPDVFSVRELPALYGSFLNKVEHNGIKAEIELIIHELLNLNEVTETEEIKRIDASIIEYSGYVKRNIDRVEYANVHNNIKKVKELIEKRNKLN